MNCILNSRTSLWFVTAVVLLGAGAALADLELDPPQTVQDAGADLSVWGYSVPSVADWDADGVPDLVVGEGGGGFPNGRVRIYRNVGTAAAPIYDGYVYALAEGDTLTCGAAGCLGLFPRVVNWNGDGRKDLLIGAADGTVLIYLNIGTDADPHFDAGALVQAGQFPPADIDIGFRATPIFVDWNLDGRFDLLCGAGDGGLYLFLDIASTGLPQLAPAQRVQENGADLVVPGGRSSPDIADFDGDGRRDLLVGNTSGQLLLYTNVGSDADPDFSGYTQVVSDGQAIDLPGDPRSRPFVCDWTGNGKLDVLIGSADGLVYLYEGQDVSTVPPSIVTVPLAAYPNPFNPRVHIAFELKESRQVELAIYSLAGRRIGELAGGLLPAGKQEFTWDGRDSRGRHLPSGQYIVRLSGIGADQQRKITLLR